MNENTKIDFRPLCEIINDATPEPNAIISNGILPHRSLLLITGKQKARKSFLAQNLAIAISEGRSFACFKIESPEKVLYLSAEGGYHGNKKRFNKMSNGTEADKNNNLYISSATRINLMDDNDYDLVKKKISDYHPGIVIIDPLVKFHSANENATNEMISVLNKLRNLIEEYDISIILVHHLGKDESKGARGSSAILGEYDSLITISKKGNTHTLDFELRHAISPDKIEIEFDPDTFWFTSTDQHPLVLLVNSSNDHMKKSIIEEAIKKNIYKSLGGIYKALKKLINQGMIIEDGDKLYSGNYL